MKQIDIELANKHETIKQAAEFIERLDLNAYIKKCMCEPIQKD